MDRKELVKSGIVLGINFADDFSIKSISEIKNRYGKTNCSEFVPRNEKMPAKVFVVTTMVQEGMEYEEQDYCGVFRNREKALSYFKSEHFDWYKKLADRYCNDGENVFTQIVKENEELEIYADYDMKDRVVIKLEEKYVQ